MTLQTSTIPDSSRMAILSNSVPNSGSTIVSQQHTNNHQHHPPDYRSNSVNVIHSPYFSIFNRVPPPQPPPQSSVSLNSISNNNRVHFPKTSRRLPQVIEYLY